jgi:hypothetical protein
MSGGSRHKLLSSRSSGRVDGTMYAAFNGPEMAYNSSCSRINKKTCLKSRQKYLKKEDSSVINYQLPSDNEPLLVSRVRG